MKLAGAHNTRVIVMTKFVSYVILKTMTVQQLWNIPVWGLGKPVHGSHAIPDDDGYVEWYDVQFKHGVEEKVMAEDVKILKNAHHNKEGMHPEKMTKWILNAMDKKLMKMKKDELLVATYKAI